MAPGEKIAHERENRIAGSKAGALQHKLGTSDFADFEKRERRRLKRLRQKQRQKERAMMAATYETMNEIQEADRKTGSGFARVVGLNGIGSAQRKAGARELLDGDEEELHLDFIAPPSSQPRSQSSSAGPAPGQLQDADAQSTTSTSYNLETLFSEFDTTPQDKAFLLELLESGAAPVEEVGLLLSARDGSVADGEVARKVFDSAREKRRKVEKSAMRLKQGLVASSAVKKGKEKVLLRNIYEFAGEAKLGEQKASLEVTGGEASSNKSVKANGTVRLDEGVIEEEYSDEEWWDGWGSDVDANGSGPPQESSLPSLPDKFLELLHSEYEKYDWGTDESHSADQYQPDQSQVLETQSRKRKRSGSKKSTTQLSQSLVNGAACPSSSTPNRVSRSVGQETAVQSAGDVAGTFDVEREAKRQRREAKRARQKAAKVLGKQGLIDSSEGKKHGTRKAEELNSTVTPKQQLPSYAKAILGGNGPMDPGRAAALQPMKTVDRPLSTNARRKNRKANRGPVTSGYFETSNGKVVHPATKVSTKVGRLTGGPRDGDDAKIQASSTVATMPRIQPDAPTNDMNPTEVLKLSASTKRERRRQRLAEHRAREAEAPGQPAVAPEDQELHTTGTQDLSTEDTKARSTESVKPAASSPEMKLSGEPDMMTDGIAEPKSSGIERKEKHKRKRNHNKLTDEQSTVSARTQGDGTMMNGVTSKDHNIADAPTKKRLPVEEPVRTLNGSDIRPPTSALKPLSESHPDEAVGNGRSRKRSWSRKEKAPSKAKSEAVTAPTTSKKTDNTIFDFELTGFKDIIERLSKDLSPSANLPFNKLHSTNVWPKTPNGDNQKRERMRRNKNNTADVDGEHPKVVHSAVQSPEVPGGVDQGNDEREELEQNDNLPKQIVQVVIYTSEKKWIPAGQQRNSSPSFDNGPASTQSTANHIKQEHYSEDDSEGSEILSSGGRKRLVDTDESQDGMKETPSRTRRRNSFARRAPNSPGSLLRDSNGRLARSASQNGKEHERSRPADARPSSSAQHQTLQPQTPRGRSVRTMTRVLQSLELTPVKPMPNQENGGRARTILNPGRSARALSAVRDSGGRFSTAGKSQPPQGSPQGESLGGSEVRDSYNREIRTSARHSSSAKDLSRSARAVSEVRNGKGRFSKESQAQGNDAAGGSTSVDGTLPRDRGRVAARDASSRRRSKTKDAVKSARAISQIRAPTGRFTKKTQAVEMSGEEEMAGDSEAPLADAESEAPASLPRESPILPPARRRSSPAPSSSRPASPGSSPSKPEPVKPKKQPLKSPFFAAILPGDKPRKENIPAPADDAHDADTSLPELRTPRKVSNVSPSKSTPKRSPGGTISCIPFPPLSAPHFGLIQEKLAHDPFRLLIAVTFLIRTHGKHAIPVFYELMQKYPTPESLAAADIEDIIHIIRHLGLQNQRAATYQTYAKTWLENPPTKGKRYPVRGYPDKDSARDVKKDEILSDCDERDAWEIAHMVQGRYALDSWRIFCRDELRGLAAGWNGEGSEQEGFQPEWMRVLPEDKELRACLRWMWLKEGFEWDPFTGEKEVAGETLVRAAMAGRIAWDEQGGMRILDGEESEPKGGLLVPTSENDAVGEMDRGEDCLVRA